MSPKTHWTKTPAYQAALKKHIDSGSVPMASVALKKGKDGKLAPDMSTSKKWVAKTSSATPYLDAFVKRAGSRAARTVDAAADAARGVAGKARSFFDSISGLGNTITEGAVDVSQSARNLADAPGSFARGVDNSSQILEETVRELPQVFSNSVDSAVNSLGSAGRRVADVPRALGEGLETAAYNVSDSAQRLRSLPGDFHGRVGESFDILGNKMRGLDQWADEAGVGQAVRGAAIPLGTGAALGLSGLGVTHDLNKTASTRKLLQSAGLGAGVLGLQSGAKSIYEGRKKDDSLLGRITSGDPLGREKQMAGGAGKALLGAGAIGGSLGIPALIKALK